MDINQAIQELKNKNIAVLGLGVNNQHLLEWLIKHGARNVTVCDRNSNLKSQISNLKTTTKNSKFFNKINWKLGENYLDNLEDFDLVFRTPGLPYLTPEIQTAKQVGVEISSQTELFLRLAPCRVVGVTGTKGKSTTAAMIAHLLEKAKSKKQKANCLIRQSAEEAELQVKNQKYDQIYLAGNIGLDPFVFIDDLTFNDIVIMELSSFQLQGLSVSPSVAVVTRVTADHLDHHENLEEYYQAKANIFNHQKKDDWLIINADEKINQNFIKEAKSQIIRYSGEKDLDYGVFVKDSEVIIRDKKGTELTAARENEGKVVGRHNLENWAAAAAIGYFMLGISAEECRESFKRYSPLPCRLEFLREINGVRYYNDSYSTNPSSMIAAVQSFPDSPIVLICGGSPKGADFSEMAKAIVGNNIRAVVLIGEEAGKIKSEILNSKSETNSKFKILNSKPKNMREILRLARNEAQKGDVILLSPGCASFDMFKNATDRGEQFNRAVNNVK